MGTADRARQYLSAYRAAVGIGAAGVAVVATAGVVQDGNPPEPPRVVSDGHTVTPPPVTVTVTASPSGTPAPSPSPSGSASPSELPTVLPSELPSQVPPSIASPTSTSTVTPTVTPSPTLTPRNHANGLKPPVCIVAIDHHGQVIKRPCKETP